MKKVTVLGGGTGTYVVLSGLKNYPLDLAVIVNMVDSGGSTGRLRDALKVLPPGDLRQCFLALSEISDLWRKLFLYRFDSGELKGHNFGNLFFAALEKVCSNYDEVIQAASSFFNIKGQVIPVTYENVHLVADYTDGKTIIGEGNIDENRSDDVIIQNVYLSSPVNATQKAIERILESEYIIIGPGDIYTSIIPVLLPLGIQEAFLKTRAKIIFIMNLMTKKGQTTNFTAQDHVDSVEKYLGRSIDCVLLNSESIPQDILDYYASHGEKTVKDDLDEKKYTIIRKDILDNKPVKFDKNDILYRSLLRHDSQKLARVLFNIFENLS
ncbi:MAG: hypothetical protein KatS3mg084_0505 [Candidatus Dojkabacteria bacterium]|nr:MAG: hypothetical protein KatS3mg084_0505 [Candidatus Dojkabacteria bacterium]